MFLEGPAIPLVLLSGVRSLPLSGSIAEIITGRCRYPILLSARFRRDALRTVPGAGAAQLDNTPDNRCPYSPSPNRSAQLWLKNRAHRLQRPVLLRPLFPKKLDVRRFNPDII
jgi:hypothetical protein